MTRRRSWPWIPSSRRRWTGPGLRRRRTGQAEGWTVTWTEGNCPPTGEKSSGARSWYAAGAAGWGARRGNRRAAGTDGWRLAAGGRTTDGGRRGGNGNGRERERDMRKRSAFRAGRWLARAGTPLVVLAGCL